MPAFSYQALDAAGKTQRGVLQGDTARAVRALLRERDLHPLRVDEVNREQDRGFFSTSLFSKKRLSSKQLALITRQLATLLSAGLPMDEALLALAEQSESEHHREWVMALRARVMEGANLAQALAEFPSYFPGVYRASVTAGEQSGQLSTVLQKLADYAEARDALRQTVWSALAYPILLAVVALVVVSGLLTYVVPQIVAVFPAHQSLPVATRVLMAVSGFVRHWGWFVVVGLILMIVGLGFVVRRPGVSLRLHHAVLRLPWIGRLVRAANAARAARTLALLVGSAVPLLEALIMAVDVVTNQSMRESLRQSATKVREGMAFSRALAESGQFPPVVLRLIASGERSGSLALMLSEAARQQQRELERWLAVMSTILGPAVIVLVGAMVLFIVLAILLPIFDLNQMIR